MVIHNLGEVRWRDFEDATKIVLGLQGLISFKNRLLEHIAVDDMFPLEGNSKMLRFLSDTTEKPYIYVVNAANLWHFGSNKSLAKIALLYLLTVTSLVHFTVEMKKWRLLLESEAVRFKRQVFPSPDWTFMKL